MSQQQGRCTRRDSGRSGRSDLSSSLQLGHPRLGVPDAPFKAQVEQLKSCRLDALCRAHVCLASPRNREVSHPACLRVATALGIRQAAVTCQGISEPKPEESSECGCEQIPHIEAEHRQGLQVTVRCSWTMILACFARKRPRHVADCPKVQSCIGQDSKLILTTQRPTSATASAISGRCTL